MNVLKDAGKFTEAGWFGRAPKDFQCAVMRLGSRLVFSRGAPVYHGGDHDADLYGIVSGCIDFTSRFSVADSPIFHISHAGTWFGVGPLVSGLPRRASATARTECTVLQVPAAALLNVLGDRPAWWREIAACAMEYGDVVSGAYADMQIPESRRRCIAALLRACGCRNPGRPDDAALDAHLTQSELAAMANVSRNTLGPILRDLQARSLVRLSYGSIMPLEPGALREIVAGNPSKPT